MNDREVLAAVLKFLDRTPIDGSEAETMVVVKAWVRQQLKPPTASLPPIS